MTARPTTPMLATAEESASTPEVSGTGRATFSAPGLPACSSADPGPWSWSVERFVWGEESFEDTRAPGVEGPLQPRVSASVLAVAGATHRPEGAHQPDATGE